MKRVVKIEWNKAGEAVGTRQIVLEVEVPVIGRDTNLVEDAILQLPLRREVYGVDRAELVGQDHGDASSSEVTWYVPAGEKEAAPEPDVVLALLRAEPARRTAAALEVRLARETREKEYLEKKIAELEQELSVPAEKCQGENTYPATVYVPPGIPEDLRVRAEEYKLELKRIASENRARVDREQEKKSQAKEARAQRKKDYIAAWAAVHGSARLQAQVAAGLDGWPLYLHERLAMDLGPDVELDNDGSDPEPLINPTLGQMEVAAGLASKLLACGQVEKGQVATSKVAVASIQFDPEEDAEYGEEQEPEVRVYACCDWFPGDPELFSMRSVRVACPGAD